MKLYQHPFSPNCQKVVALASEVGTPLELATLEIFKGEARTPAMRAKNPNGKLPILEDGEFVLWESTAMLAYIAAKAGRTDLAPTTPRERAEVDRWTAWQGAHFGPAIRKVAFERIVKKLVGRGAPDEAVVKAGMEEFATTASVLEESLGAKEYLCGTLTIADFHRIATKVCLDELAKRPRRARAPELGPPSDPDAPIAARTADDEWLEPAPSAWLAGAGAEGNDPAAEYTMKESVALAFVAALQVLTAAQRAVLLLRDVVGLSAVETAEALACSVPSANSALHRARAALEERVGPRAGWSPESGVAVDRALLERYVRAWERGDLEAIIALLHEEVTLSMPPSPTWIAGRPDVARFFTTRAHQALRGVLVEANGEVGAGFYRLGDGGKGTFFALQLLEAKEGRILVIDHFMAASSHQAFFAEGLARTIAATPR